MRSGAWGGGFSSGGSSGGGSLWLILSNTYLEMEAFFLIGLSDLTVVDNYQVCLYEGRYQIGVSRVLSSSYLTG